MSSALNPWQAPVRLRRPPLGLADVYGGIAGLALVLAPLFIALHLLAGGILATYIVEWHVAHGLTTAMPQMMFYGGGLAMLLVPLSFAIASSRLRREPDSWAWRVAPWLSWLVWPVFMVSLSLLFDLFRWNYAPGA